MKVSTEYQEISASIEKIKTDTDKIHTTINEAFENGIAQFGNSIIIKITTSFAVIAGLIMTAISSPIILSFVKDYGAIIGLLLVIAAVVILFLANHK